MHLRGINVAKNIKTSTFKGALKALTIRYLMLFEVFKQNRFGIGYEIIKLFLFRKIPLAIRRIPKTTDLSDYSGK